MTHFDIFNDDADGICSLLQLRLAASAESVLITVPSATSRRCSASMLNRR